MLPAAHRLHRAADFAEVVRRGRRASRPLLTVHVLASAAAGAGIPARAGLVVSKAVGGSVVRHRTARRLRHLLLPRLSALAAGTSVVVRAQPGAGTAPSRALAGDLDGALASAVRPKAPR